MKCSIFLLVSIVLREGGAAVQGPETELTVPDKRFVHITCASSQLIMVGVVVSKAHVVVPSLALSPSCVFRFKDVSARGEVLDILTFYSGVGEFGLVKVCPRLHDFTAVDFRASAFPGHTVNYTSDSGAAVMHYHRESNQKVYTTTIDIWDDTTCAIDATNYVCNPVVPCGPFKDVVNGAAYYLLPWLIINGQPVGFERHSRCTTLTEDVVKFAKVTGARTQLVALNPAAFLQA